MKYNDRRLAYVFRNGKRIEIPEGLSINEALQVAWSDGSTLLEATLPEGQLTAAQKMELGFYMADLWQKYAIEAGIVFEREDRGRQNRAARTGKKTRQEVHHTCGDPTCNDIKHLRLVTVVES
jgi:hypothetical protein